MDHWTKPTAYLQRFGDAMQLLCGGNRPADEIMRLWLDPDADSIALQEFACEHGPSWAQGIAIIDAARVLADQPTEGVEHQPQYTPSAHYPVEWGPSDDRRMTCSCGNADPAHRKTPNVEVTGGAKE